MSGHGAEVVERPLLLERDDEPRRLARLDQRRLLSPDAEVVKDVAGVLEDERGRAWLRHRLRRELEEELAAADLDRRRRRGRLLRAARRGELDECERGDRDGGERKG